MKKNKKTWKRKVKDAAVWTAIQAVGSIPSAVASMWRGPSYGHLVRKNISGVKKDLWLEYLSADGNIVEAFELDSISNEFIGEKQKVVCPFCSAEKVYIPSDYRALRIVKKKDIKPILKELFSENKETNEFPVAELLFCKGCKKFFFICSSCNTANRIFDFGNKICKNCKKEFCL